MNDITKMTNDELIQIHNDRYNAISPLLKDCEDMLDDLLEVDRELTLRENQ